MLRLFAGALLFLVALSTGCGGDDNGAESDEERQAAVYTAVIQDVAATLPSGGQEPAERTVFVEPLDPESEIGLEVQAGVVLALEDVVEVSFIDEREAAVDGEQDGAPVRDGAALIALGPVPEGGRRAVVDVERYEREGQEELLRFVVERGADGWQVAERLLIG